MGYFALPDTPDQRLSLVYPNVNVKVGHHERPEIKGLVFRKIKKLKLLLKLSQPSQ